MKMDMDDSLENDSFDVMSDTPISNNNTPELLRALINNDTIPEEVRLKHWEIFNPDITLSFQDEKSKNNKMLDFDLMKVDYLMATPWYKYTFEKESLWNKLRLLFETKLDRAMGFKTNGRVNERLVQQSQFAEQKVVKTIDSQGAAGGILSGLLGRKR